MTTADQPLQPGDLAPDFQLPAVNREGTVSLADYRGKSPVLVGLFRGLHCPFCRRQIARLSQTQEKLAREGVQTVAVVNTPAQRARQYFQYRPTSVVLAADPDVSTHRAYGLRPFAVLPDETDPNDVHWPQSSTMERMMKTRSTANGELPEAMNLMAVMDTLNTRDQFEMTDVDQHIKEAHMTQLAGQFLIDSAGKIRWSFVEAPDSPDQLGQFPSDDEVLSAARAASRQ